MRQRAEIPRVRTDHFAPSKAQLQESRLRNPVGRRSQRFEIGPLQPALQRLPFAAGGPRKGCFHSQRTLEAQVRAPERDFPAPNAITRVLFGARTAVSKVTLTSHEKRRKELLDRQLMKSNQQVIHLYDYTESRSKHVVQPGGLNMFYDRARYNPQPRFRIQSRFSQARPIHFQKKRQSRDHAVKPLTRRFARSRRPCRRPRDKMSFVSINSGSDRPLGPKRKKMIALNLDSPANERRRLIKFDRKHIVKSLLDRSLSCQF